MRNQTIHIPIKKIITMAIFTFIGLFAVQVAYRSLNPDYNIITDSEIKQVFYKSQKNYTTLDQNESTATIYEKIAFLKSKSKSFDNDQELLLKLIKQANGIIQLELQAGLIGQRVYYISAGVPSLQFNEVINQAKGIASLESSSIETISQPANVNNVNNLSTIQLMLIEAHSNGATFIYSLILDSLIWAISVMFMVLLFGSVVGFCIWILILINRQVLSKKDQRFK